MLKFVATAKIFLWEFVELAFLAVLALVLLSILLGKNAGGYVESVADNASKFASSASSGLLGIVIILAIIYLAMRRMKPGSRTPRPRDATLTRELGACAQAVWLTETPLSLSACCNSPAWNISRTMSQPPTNSPFT